VSLEVRAQSMLYLLVQPASLEVRAHSALYLLAQPASLFAHALNRVCQTIGIASLHFATRLLFHSPQGANQLPNLRLFTP
jgi:hypothetical protein